MCGSRCLSYSKSQLECGRGMKSIARKGKHARASARIKAKRPGAKARADLHTLADPAVLAVDRAAGELRRGFPALIIPPRGQASFVAAAELASPTLLDAMAAWSRTP